MYRVETVWGAMWYRPRDSLYRAVGSGHSESGSGGTGFGTFRLCEDISWPARATPGREFSELCVNPEWNPEP